MECGPAIVLLSAVVVLLVANLVAVLYVSGASRRYSVVQESPDERDELDARAAIAERIALLDTEIRHLEDLAVIHAEVARL